MKYFILFSTMQSMQKLFLYHRTIWQVIFNFLPVMANFLPVNSLNIEQKFTKVTCHCDPNFYQSQTSFVWHWSVTDEVSHRLTMYPQGNLYCKLQNISDLKGFFIIQKCFNILLLLELVFSLWQVNMILTCGSPLMSIWWAPFSMQAFTTCSP